MPNAILEKSFAFAVQVVRIANHLQSERREYVLSKQLLRSGTSIGALVRESQNAESRADFVHKLSIALKESNETAYWLELLHASEYLTAEAFRGLRDDVRELLRLLVAIIKATKTSTRDGPKRKRR